MDKFLFQIYLTELLVPKIRTRQSAKNQDPINLQWTTINLRVVNHKFKSGQLSIAAYHVEDKIHPPLGGQKETGRIYDFFISLRYAASFELQLY